MIEETVQIRCTRCKNVFRDRAARLQNGYSRQCPSCEVVLFFDEDSPNADIKRAMTAARQLRKELRESELARLLAPRPAMGHARGYTGRHAPEEQE